MNSSFSVRTAVEVFAEVMCPFTHIGLRRFVAERAAGGVARPLIVRAWPLEWINGRPLSPQHVAAEIDALRETVAPGLFAGFDPATFPTTSIPAFGLAVAAYAVGVETGEAVSLAIRDALFEHGLDVADLDVLRAIGAVHGVEPMERKAADIVIRADWERGKRRGVRGSPHFFADGAQWFCPGLAIEKIDDRFAVAAAAGARAFYDAVLV
jgi:predicted DsbA family dithiol-disulfide isomerase